MSLHIDPGGEAFLPFAKKSLRDMKAEMQRLGLLFKKKWIQVSASERIFLQSQNVFGNYIDHIVIRVGTWDFCVSVSNAAGPDDVIYTFRHGTAAPRSVVVGQNLGQNLAFRSHKKPFAIGLDTELGWRKVTPAITAAQASINPLTDRTGIHVFMFDVSGTRFGGVVYNADSEGPGPVLFDGVSELEFARPEYDGVGDISTPICIATKTQHFAAWQTGPASENAGSIIVGLTAGTIHTNTDGTRQIAQCSSAAGGKGGFALAANYYNLFYAVAGYAFPGGIQSIDIRSDAGSLLFVGSEPGRIVGFKATKDQLFVCRETHLTDEPDEDENYTVRVAIHKFQRQEDGSYVHSVTSRDVLSLQPADASPICSGFEISESTGHAYIQRVYYIVFATEVQEVAEIQNSDGTVTTLADGLALQSPTSSVSLKTRAAFIRSDVDGTGAESLIRITFTDGEEIIISGDEGNMINWSAAGFVGTANHVFCNFINGTDRYFAGTDGTSVNVSPLIAGDAIATPGILIDRTGAAFMIVIGVTVSPFEVPPFKTRIHHVSTAGEVFDYKQFPGFVIPQIPSPSTILRAQQLEAWA